MSPRGETGQGELGGSPAPPAPSGASPLGQVLGVRKVGEAQAESGSPGTRAPSAHTRPYTPSSGL